MFPWNVLLVPRVAELPTCQNTFLGRAPPARMTSLAGTRGTGCRGQCGHDLEDPDTSRRAAESEIAGYSQRGLRARRLVNARGEGLPSYICGENGPSGFACDVVIRRGQVSLGGCGDRIARVERAG